MTKKQPSERTEVTIPKYYYDMLIADAELVRHLTHYRGIGWINAVREELETDKKYNQGAFKIARMNGKNRELMPIKSHEKYHSGEK